LYLTDKKYKEKENKFRSVH